MLVTIEKELGKYFQRLHFWNQWVPLIKMYCSMRYLFNFDLKIHSGQVWAVCICSFCKSLEWMCIHKGRLVKLHSCNLKNTLSFMVAFSSPCIKRIRMVELFSVVSVTLKRLKKLLSCYYATYTVTNSGSLE